MVVTLAGIILGAIFSQPRALGITALVAFSVILLGWRVTQSARLGWLLVFGLVAGVLELWSDWLHVVYLQSLVYTDYFGLKLLASPAYMPLGWWLTVVQFGYWALRLSERWVHWVVVAILSLIGMTLPPWYEELAAPAQAWHYVSSGIMLSHTPLWIIFTYGGCMFAIATLALVFYRQGAWGRAVLGGLFTGASLMFSSVFWFALLGRG